MAAITMKSEFPGRVSAIEAAVGEAIAEEDVIAVLESMKMEIPLAAPAAGTLKAVLIAVGDMVAEGQEVAVIET